MNKQNFNKWRRLDNTAKIFSLDHKNNTNIFRYSVILKRKVEKSILIQALRKTIDKFLAFKVKIGSGLFWEYLEYNNKEIFVEEENGVPCHKSNFKNNNNYLFKVTYYKEKINMDVCHILTDGMGALEFFKALLCNYIDIRYKRKQIDYKCNKIDYKDRYLENYDRKMVLKHNTKFAYMLPGKVDKNINNTYHYIIDVEEIKKVCKKRGVSISQFVTALYAFSLYSVYYKIKSKKDIVITVPIDLRRFCNCKTLSNFFTCMNICAGVNKDEVITFDKVLDNVKEEFQSKLTDKKVKQHLSRDVFLGMFFPIRIAPLFIKKLFMECMGGQFCRTVTSTMSNVGCVDFGYDYNKYIDDVFVLVLPNRIQKIKCTMCSFSNKLNITMNSNINDLEFEKKFNLLLKKYLKKVKVISNVTNF